MTWNRMKWKCTWTVLGNNDEVCNVVNGDNSIKIKRERKKRMERIFCLFVWCIDEWWIECLEKWLKTQLKSNWILKKKKTQILNVKKEKKTKVMFGVLFRYWSVYFLRTKIVCLELGWFHWNFDDDFFFVHTNFDDFLFANLFLLWFLYIFFFCFLLFCK